MSGAPPDGGAESTGVRAWTRSARTAFPGLSPSGLFVALARPYRCASAPDFEPDSLTLARGAIDSGENPTSWAQEGRLSHGELAHSVHLTHGGITRLLQGLGERGLSRARAATPIGE